MTTLPNSKFQILNSKPWRKVAFVLFLILFSLLGFPRSSAASLLINRPLYIGLSEGLVGHWSFDGSTIAESGKHKVLDISGNGFHGAFVNATPTPVTIGKIGQALNFDRATDYVDIGAGPSSVKSVSFWVNPKTTTEYFINISGTTKYINVLLGTVNAILFTSPTIYVDGVVSSTLVADKWQNVVVTTDTAVDANNIDIGRVANGGAFMNGSIDEVRIYDRVLTPDEVKRLHKMGSTFTINKTRLDTMREGLVGHWTFDGSDVLTQNDGGQIALDRSVQGVNGTIQGSSIAIGEIATTSLTSGSDNTDQDVYTTASISPSANALVLAAVVTATNTATERTITLSGNGLTWVQIDSLNFNPGNPERRVTLFRALGPSPSAGAVTITSDGTNTIGCLWSIVEFSGVDISGTNGSGAIVQSANNTANATSITVTLGSFSSTGNATYGAFGIDTNEAQTVGSGFTAIHDVETTAPVMEIFTEWKKGNDTSVDESSATSDLRGGIAVEMKKPSAAHPPTVPGRIGQALNFDGTNDYVDIGAGPSSVKSVSFWVNPKTTTEYLVNLTGTTDYIWVNAGTITATGLTSPTIYVDGAVSSTLVADKWQQVVVTTDTAENASTLDIGRTQDANYMEGHIDDVRLYGNALSSDEVKRLHKMGATFTINKPSNQVTQGLAGYWSFDGPDMAAGTNQWAIDRSGNGINGQLVSGPKRVIGKIGQALNFNGTDDYVDIGTGPSSVKSASFWVNPKTTTEYFLNLTGTTDYIWVNAGTVTATGLISPTIYVDGVVSSTLVANKWQHVVVTTNTAENASNFDIGRTQDANYMEGRIDDVRLYNHALSADEIKTLHTIGR